MSISSPARCTLSPPTRSTATAADAAAIIREMCLRSGDGFPDVLVVDHDSKFTSEVFRAFVKV